MNTPLAPDRATRPTRASVARLVREQQSGDARRCGCSVTDAVVRERGWRAAAAVLGGRDFLPIRGFCSCGSAVCWPAPVGADASVSTREVGSARRDRLAAERLLDGAAGANAGRRAGFDYVSGRLCRREPATSGPRPRRRSALARFQLAPPPASAGNQGSGLRCHAARRRNSGRDSLWRGAGPPPGVSVAQPALLSVRVPFRLARLGRNGDVTALQRCYAPRRRHQVRQPGRFPESSLTDLTSARCVGTGRWVRGHRPRADGCLQRSAGGHAD
jgi:hypothetical protein